jgi:polysaccharide export outer membrane protein
VGDIQAAGKTVSDIREEVTKRLARYIPDPVVSVTLQKIGSHRVYVIGKVNKPGDFPVGRYIDVLQALAMAGGLTPFAAADDIKIIRRDGTRSASLPFQYSRVERGQNLEQNIVLRAGDVVVVP